MFLDNASKFKDIPGLKLAYEISTAANRAQYDFLKNASNFKDIPGLDLAHEISKAAPNAPSDFMNNASNFKDIPGLDLAHEISKAAPNAPSEFIDNASDFKDIKGLNLAEEIIKANQFSPSNFLNQAIMFEDIPGLNLTEEILKAANRAPYDFLKNASNFEDMPGLKLAEEILKAARKDPSAFLLNASNFEGIPGLNLAGEISRAAEKGPSEFLSRAPDFEGIAGLELVDEIIKAASKEPRRFLYNVSKLKDIEGLDLFEEISKAANKDPESYIDQFSDLESGIDESKLLILLDKALEAYPTNFYWEDGKDYFKDKNIINLKNISFLLKIENPKAANLYHLMVKNNLSEKEAIEIVDNENIYLKKLIEINSIPNHLGKVSIDKNLKITCLNMVQEINSLHEANDEKRFKSIKGYGAKELYSLMVYGEEEIFTSSFNGLFNRLKLRLDTKKGGISGKQLIDQVGKDKFRIFIKECAGFNRLNEFLSTMNKVEADNLLTEVVKNIEITENKLAQAVTVANILGNIEDMETLKTLQKHIKAEYERIDKNSNSKKEDKIIYGLLCGMFKDNALIEKEWFKNKSKSYPIDKVTGLKSSELFNKKGLCIQKYYFYENGDGDGVNSFNNFVKTVENDSRWKITRNNKGFIIIRGINKGKTIEIYANIPKLDNGEIDGADEMNKYMADKKLQINVYTYRGHSFGFRIDGDISKASIVNVGSCGGYNNILPILTLSPHAHILSTQGIGTKYINDPILWKLNNLILSGEDIVWKNYWESLSPSIKNNDNFKNYVPPNKNQGAMFIKGFNALNKES